MKSLFASNRNKALLGIGVLAIGIGTISKKVISYPSEGCIKAVSYTHLTLPTIYSV